MFPRLLMLTAAFSVAIAIAVGTTRAQETTTEATTSTDMTTTIIITEPLPLVYMDFSTFRAQRSELKRLVNLARWRRCGKIPIRFLVRHADVRPELREPNLAGWQRQLDRARASAPRCWNYREGHFHVALKWAANTFGTWYDRVHNCVHSEGSDRMVWNGGTVDPDLRYYPGPAPGGISSVYGPAQFMESTFYRMIGAAWSWMKSHGIKVRHIPTRLKRWNSFAGQAMAMSWGFANGRAGEWTGSGCR